MHFLWYAVPKGVNNTEQRETTHRRGETAPYLETPLVFSFCRPMYTVTLQYIKYLFFVYLDGSVSVCVCDMCYTVRACQLVAQGRLLACLTSDDWPIQQKSGCLDTNLAPIYGSTAAEWTNAHKHTKSHTHNKQYLKPHCSGCGWLHLFVCLLTNRLSYNVVFV